MSKIGQSAAKKTPEVNNSQQSAKKQPPKKQLSKKDKAPVVKTNKYKMDFIKKDNFDTMHHKINITQIKQLRIKYVLNCIDGIFKNRFLYITTHKEGEIIGSGDAKLYGLTLQIQSAGLAPKHAQLKFDGFKQFDVLDYGSQSGTWMNIPKQGVEVRDGQFFTIGPYIVQFIFSIPINQIEQICMCFHITSLSDTLQYNGIKSINQLLTAQYNNFKDYPFEQKDKQKLIRICNQTRKWYVQNKSYKRIIANFINQPLDQFSIEIGWEPYYFSHDPQFIFSAKKPIAQLVKGKLIPNERVFTKIQPDKKFGLSLHSQLKIGNLLFELKRFNTGIGLDIGYRPNMQDGLLVEEDIGGSQWKLISLFAVFDGHGGTQCMQFLKENLVQKVKQWTKLLDEAGDLNEMIKILFNKTFFELDYEFYKKYPDIAMTCGATALVMMIIQSKVFVFSIGDCKGFLFRNQIIYQLNLDHLPSRGDERLRIQNAGGFIQYDRLMGKCTLSRCFGQFQYKNIEDYEHNMKGKLKSYLSCLPDVVSFDLDAHKDDFILLSTDGIFQSMTVAEMTDFITQKQAKLQAEQSPNKIMSSIIQNCKILSPDSDNMAAILLIIRKGLVGAPKAW